MSVDNAPQQRKVKVRASELVGRNWLNTGGNQLDLAALRGKIVVLDFWTFCCINCLHVIDELHPLEEKYSDVLVTVGVHSPKFEHEADPVAVAAAVQRYNIAHPVLDDPNLITWQAYGARAWPTLVVIDPEGYIVAQLSGEGHASGLELLVEELVAEHEAKGTLHRGQGPYVPPEPQSGTLSFPGKVAALSNGNYLVSDTGHHRLVEMEPDLETVVHSYGSGTKGFADGPADQAQFNEPQGLTVLPDDIAERVGYDVVVADSVNHRLRGINTTSKVVSTLAGNGVQRLLETGPGTVDSEGKAALRILAEGEEATAITLSSPWDVVYSHALEKVVIAMAGVHQIFAFEPVTQIVEILAGTGLEGLLDGPASEAWFAQSSGLAEDSAGNLWVADSETSALRKLTVSDDGEIDVSTVIGEGLYDFGFRDGDAGQARLQHPLGVAALPDGSIAVADTYNGAIRRYDPVSGSVSTLAQGLAEPTDVLLDGELLLVVEANKHQVIRIPLPEEAVNVDQGASQTQRPRTAVRAGELALAVEFAAPKGQKLDDRWGDPTQLKVTSTPPELLVEGEGTAVGLRRSLQLNDSVESGVLHITARAAACDGEPGGDIPDHAACHLYQQDWGIPVFIDPHGESELVLDLRGVR